MQAHADETGRDTQDAAENDVMLVIGSRTSANTKRLFEISMSLNKRTYWITDAARYKKVLVQEG
jgi:4-hydroxy-3-methylbut-2-enyl diphosphate reductase IspH